jgi:AcrR family transcriptional regulator
MLLAFERHCGAAALPTTQRTAPAKARRQPKQQRSAQLVADIFEATAQVLAERGPERASTNRIAERAGVSIGAIYQYFPNKAALFDALARDRFQKLNALTLDRLSQAIDVPFPQAAEIVLRSFIDFLTENPGLGRIIVELMQPYISTPALMMAEAQAVQAAKIYLMRYRDTLDIVDLDTAARLSGLVVAAVGTRVLLDRPSPERRELMIRETVRMLSLYVGAVPPVAERN